MRRVDVVRSDVWGVLHVLGKDGWNYACRGFSNPPQTPVSSWKKPELVKNSNPTCLWCVAGRDFDPHYSNGDAVWEDAYP